MTDADVADKFRGLAGDVLGSARVETALRELWRLDEHPRTGPVLDLLVAPAPTSPR